jgi:hypothetical protein
MTEKLLRTGQVAKILGISRERVNQLVRAGALIPAHSLDKMNLFQRAEVEVFRERERKRGRPPKPDSELTTKRRRAAPEK